MPPLQIQVTVKYKAGHSYQYRYEQFEECFCPSCGEKSVWYETGPGDYEQGPTHVCIDCNSSFTLPQGTGEPRYTEDQVVEQIKHKLLEVPTGSLLPTTT